MKTIILFLLLLLTAPLAQARVESWYTYWSIGISRNTYPTALQQAIDQVDAIPGVNRVQIGLDMLGFYWPLSDNKTILGFVMNGDGDRLSDQSNYIQINTYLYGLSAMHFFGDEPGQGFFLRGDYGISTGVTQSNYGTSQSNQNGTGFLVGTGYGIAISDETRIILGVSYTSKTIESEIYNSTLLTIGGLW